MSIGFNPWNLIRSLKSADQWSDTINGNILGATRTAYKSTEVMFGGGLSKVERPYTNNQAGIQVAEQQVNIGYTRLNWKQGDVVKTDIETNFAIQGRGFFLVADPKTTNWGSSPIYFNGTGVGANKGYLTKDGDYHWAIVTNAAGVNVGVAAGITGNASDPVLVNNEGLVVLADYVGSSSDNWMAPVAYSQYISASAVRPSIVEPTRDGTGGGAVSQLDDYESLRFSKYGSTIFEAPTSTMFKTIVNGSNGVLDRRNSTDVMESQARLIEKALESSNVDLEGEVGELSASKSFYEALTKNFLVYLDNTDSALRLFR